jgi:hypothetical protein
VVGVLSLWVGFFEEEEGVWSDWGRGAEGQLRWGEGVGLLELFNITSGDGTYLY